MTSIDNKMVSYDEVKRFDHTWELGMRKAKELLFTDDAIDVAKEHRIGRINQIVPRDEREKLVLTMVGYIAAEQSFSRKLAKLAVKQTRDMQWFQLARQHVGQPHSCAEHLREIGVGTIRGIGRPHKVFDAFEADVSVAAFDG